MIRTNFSFLDETKRLWFENRAEKYLDKDPQGDLPWTPFKEKLLNSTIAFISSSGAYVEGMKPFKISGEKGDCTFREIPTNTLQDEIRFSNVGWNSEEAMKDPNVVFPMERILLLQKEGFFGKFHNPAYTFVSNCDEYKRFRKNAASLIKSLKEAGVNGVILTPSSYFCFDLLGNLARQIEAAGISTVCYTIFYENAVYINAPRTAFINFPPGFVFGRSGEISLHTAILRDGLRMFEKCKIPGEIINLRYVWQHGKIPDWDSKKNH